MDVAATRVPALEIESLRVDYGDFTAVHDLSLELAPGEIFGLVGPNGAGKTSTIRVLATLLEPTYGEIRIAGHDLFEEPEAVHAIIGYMPDLAPVIPDLRVWEFLDLYAASHGYVGRDKRERVDTALAKVKLADKRKLFGRELSRGMTQRVVLAKTLLHEPRLLLLDEPASGMDPIARRDMRVILQELARAGAAVVISSHILSELSGMCTSVGIMHEGRLMNHGSMATVLSSLEVGSVDVEMEVLDRVDLAVELLDARDDIGEVRVEGARVAFTLTGDKGAQSALLAALVERGVGISAFTPARSDIESLLMKLVEEQ